MKMGYWWLMILISGWWLSHLYTPMKNDGRIVSWDDDILNMMGKKNVPNFQTTNQKYIGNIINKHCFLHLRISRVTVMTEKRDGGHIRPWKRVTFAPEPKGVTFAPEPQYFQCGTQPFRVKPGDKGAFRGTGETLGGTWGHMLTCLSIQYVAQPFRVKPGDKGAFRGTGEPLGGTWGHMVTCLSIQYATQPVRVKPGDKGTFRGTGEPLGGTWGHMVACLSIQYVTQPFRV